MPVYRLTDELGFPPPMGATEEGLVAVGGDASAERLLLAYSLGIFPWPMGDKFSSSESTDEKRARADKPISSRPPRSRKKREPLLWFSPDPRCVLPLERVTIPRSTHKKTKQAVFEVRCDTAFDEVIRACASVPRPGQDGTWITQELIEGFIKLHALGFAHSIETYLDNKLVGGLYGISLGKAFFGESMFANAPEASKVAFATLLATLQSWHFDFVDCQVATPHTLRFGAINWARDRFLGALYRALEHPTRRGPWSL